MIFVPYIKRVLSPLQCTSPISGSASPSDFDHSLSDPMRTRSGFSYPKSDTGSFEKKRKRSGEEKPGRKKPKIDFFDSLPDDLLLSILCKLSSSAESPSDLVNVLMTCKRMNELGLNPIVLKKVSAESLAIRAKNWSDSAHRFLKRCVEAGSLEASYVLGMIKFYCLENRPAGAALMAKAAMGSHAEAMYSLAIIQFNGSGGSKIHKDLRAGFALCARSAYLGHVGALCELGHCLQDGYGVLRNVSEGRRFLLESHTRDLASKWTGKNCRVRPVNRFMVEWAGSRPVGADCGLGCCSYGGCGRPETRRQEFRQCSVCRKERYCSRGCQAVHWRLEHKKECREPAERWAHRTDAAGIEDPLDL